MGLLKQAILAIFSWGCTHQLCRNEIVDTLTRELPLIWGCWGSEFYSVNGAFWSIPELKFEHEIKQSWHTKAVFCIFTFRIDTFTWELPLIWGVWGFSPRKFWKLNSLNGAFWAIAEQNLNVKEGAGNGKYDTLRRISLNTALSKLVFPLRKEILF